MEEIDFKQDPYLVYVVGGGLPVIKMFFERGYRGAKHVKDADVVVFTGGADVDPSLYNEKALKKTVFDRERDEYEMDAFREAQLLDIPCVGICRGGQFLNVMNGGKLWQHVNNHTASHEILDSESNEKVNVTSTHHQMMIPYTDGLILAMAAESTIKLSDGTELSRPVPDFDDVEVVWYEDTKCLCFQPHPEFGNGECRDYFWRLFDKIVAPIIDQSYTVTTKEK